MTLTAQLVEHCHAVRYEDLPPAAVLAAKTELLDSLGVGLAGFAADGIQELLEVAREWGGARQASVIGSELMLPAPNAAMVNGAMMHALDYDCGHTAAFVHTGVVTVPAVLAAAERAGGVSGRDFIAAAAVGTDLFCRLGLGLVTDVNKAQTGWHWTSVLGYLSSAAIAARLFGLDKEQTRNAIGIAYHQCAGNTQCVSGGAQTKRMGPGFAVRGGLAAAVMAERGITGADDVLDGKFGLARLYLGQESYATEVCLADLGRRFEGVNADLKIYPCGGMMDPFIDAALELVHSRDIAPGDIEAVTVFHGDGAREFVTPLEVKRFPRNAVDTQFSIPWTVAVAIVRRHVGLESFTSLAIRDPELLSVSGKVEAEFDPGLNKAVGLEPGRVELRLKNGKSVACQKDNHMAGSKGAVPFEKVVEKFMACADFSALDIPRDRLSEVVEMVRGLDGLDDATRVVRLLR